jgi:ABC-2 type transport system permease protein
VKPLLAQARTELQLSLRQGEQLLVSLGIPLLILVFFSLVDVLPKPDGVDDPVDFLTPGVLALAVMSSAMVSLGIGTGFERQYKVLKRLGTTPLGRPRLVGAKVLMVLVVEVIQVVAIIAVATALGWRPVAGSTALAVPAIVLGTAAFAGLGLLMAGTLRGTVTLAVDNALYLVLLLLGGMVVPLDRLPAGIRAVAELLPAAALAETLNAALRDLPTPGRAWVVLAVWAVATPLAAARWFRWE